MRGYTPGLPLSKKYTLALASQTLQRKWLTPQIISAWILTTRLQLITLLSSSTPLSYSRRRMLSAIGTILDSLIIFRISFPLVKEVNPPPSRLYIPQLSPSTIISRNGNMSLKGLCTPLHNVLYIWSALSLSLICQYLTPVPILTPQSLLISIPLGDTLCLWTSLTLTPDCCCRSPILVPQSCSQLLVLCSLLHNKFRRRSSLILFFLSRLPVPFLGFQSLQSNSSRQQTRSPDLVAVSLQSHCTRSSISVNLCPFLLLGFHSACLVLFLVQFCSLPCLVFQFDSSIFLWLYNDNYCPILHSSLCFRVITTSGDFSILFPMALHESSWASMPLCLSCLVPWSGIHDISHSDLLIDRNIITTYPTISA